MTRRTTRASLASLGAATLAGGNHGRPPARPEPERFARCRSTRILSSSRRRPPRTSPATRTTATASTARRTPSTAGRTAATSSRSRPPTPRPSCSRSATRTWRSLPRRPSRRWASTTRSTSSTMPPTARSSTQPNGTGPYKFSSWDLDQRIDLTANDAYWGTKALTPNLEFQWNNDGAAKFLALSSGAVDGIDNPGKDDLPTLRGRRGLQVKDRERHQHDVLRHEQHVRAVEQRRRCARPSPWASTASGWWTTSSRPAPRWRTTSRRARWRSPARAPRRPRSTPQPPRRCCSKASPRKASTSRRWTSRSSTVPLPRGYVNDPPAVAQDVVAQLQENLGLKAHTDEHENTTYLGESNAGTLEGLFLLGWGMDFPDASNFLTYHFGSGTGVKFGDPYPDLVETITTGDQSIADADRAAAYSQGQRPASSSMRRSSSRPTRAPRPPGRRISRVPTRPRCRPRSSRS